MTMLRLHRREVANIVSTMPGHPILRVPPEQLVEPEIAEIIIPAAVTIALAGEGGSVQRSIDYLSGVAGVVIDADSFTILSQSDIHPLVAVALAHYHMSCLGAQSSIDFKVDAFLGGNDAGFYLVDDFLPGPMLDLNYELGGGGCWMAWQRIVRLEAQLELPQVLNAAIAGQPLARLLSHPALDRIGLVIDSIHGEDVHIAGVHRWVEISDLHALYRDLATCGMCRAPAQSDVEKSGVLRLLNIMAKQARERADRLEAAVAQIIAS